MRLVNNNRNLLDVSKEELMSCHSVEPKPEEPPHSAPVTEPQPPVEWFEVIILLGG